MTHEEALLKARETTGSVYEIKSDCAETAKSLVGKTLSSKKPGNDAKLEIVDWVGQNYVLKVGDGDYAVTPVMWVLTNLSLGKIKVS